MKTSTKVLTLGTLVAGVLLWSRCSSIPKSIKPVQNFDIKKYAGKWYEIARFDYRFEKNLNNVTAEYSLNEDGSVTVLNTGFDTTKNKWKSSKGKAKFRGDNDVAALKVSFFGPFYAGYNVVALDENYQHALVAGRNLDYVWILSRSKNLDDNIKKQYVEKAKNIGYDVSRFIWVDQSHPKK